MAALLAAAPSAARAQSAEAEALFIDGEALMAAGSLSEACAAFEASNRIESRAGTLIHLGDCREQNGQLASAWSAYKDALRLVKDPRKKKIAVAAVAALEPRLSYLTISVPGDSQVDGLVITRNGTAVEDALWNRAIPVDGGAYVIGGRAPGHEEWTTAVTVPREGGRTSIDVPKFKELEVLIAPAPTAAPVPDVFVDAAIGRRAPARLTGRRKAALVLGGIGVATLGFAAVIGVQATGTEADAFALCPDPAAPCGDAAVAGALVERARSRALLANVGYGVGAAAVVGAAILWLTGAPIAPRLQPGYAGFDVEVRF